MEKSVLIIDPIPFRGGSKVATETIVEQLLDNGTRVLVLTRDSHSWKNSQIKRYYYKEFPYVVTYESGIGYFIKHTWIALWIGLLWLRHLGQLSLVGASGPGVDLSIYLVKKILPIEVIQLIHGPVARSKTIARCLLAADTVAYLPSSKESIIDALTLLTTDKNISQVFSSAAYVPMINGISSKRWPQPITQQDNSLRVLWAASLLKWKGLGVLVSALNQFNSTQQPKTTICYIKPKETELEVSDLPPQSSTLTTLESPNNLNEIRSKHHVFVSTSHQEPFGLSILEAMAAGLCVCIPADGAYWDNVLVDGVTCIKYRPNDATDLHDKLVYLALNIKKSRKIGKAAQLIAANYRAELTYHPIIDRIKKLDKKERRSNSFCRGRTL